MWTTIWWTLVAVWGAFRYGYVYWFRRNERKRLQNLFGVDPDTFLLHKVGEARAYFPPNPAHALLLCTGFSNFPSAMDALLPKLRALNVAYYVPRHPWCGCLSQEAAHVGEPEDVFRAYEEAYQLLRKVYPPPSDAPQANQQTAPTRISILGHSAGANSASWLAHRHPVHALFLLAPNLAPAASNRWIAKYALRPRFLRDLMGVLVGYRRVDGKIEGRNGCVNTVNPDHYASGEYVGVWSLRSIVSLFDLQKRSVELPSSWQVQDSVHAWFGEYESTVAPWVEQEPIVKRLAPDTVPIRYHFLPGTAHNLLHEGEKTVNEVAECLAEVLRA